jgi:hypothetical protein
MIDVPREFWGRLEAFQRYLEAQGLSSKKNLDVSRFRAPDIDKGLPNIEPRLLAPLEKPRTKSAGYVRDFAPVSFEPNPFPPQPVSTVKWRGRGPGCPTITLACNSISASKSKCGYPEFGTPSSPPKIYLTRTYSHTRTGTSCCEGTYGEAICGDGGRQEHADRIYSYDPIACTESVDYPAVTYDAVHNYSYQLHCNGSQYSVGPAGEFISGYTVVSQTLEEIALDDGGPCGTTTANQALCNSTFSRHIYISFTLSDEYTTALLISNTEDALPDYAACFGCDTSSEGCSALISGQGCTCSAFANTSTNEISRTIRRFKYKFKFPNPGMDGYLKILWNETFKPTLSAGVTYCGSSYATGAEDPDPAHWTTSAMSEVFGSGDTESSEHEVTEPSSNGTIYVTDIRWTNTEGCEPDASSIEGVDQFASSTSDTYLCNDRDPADKNCTCPA